MNSFHDLLRSHGLAIAREKVSLDDRRFVEIAAAVRAEQSKQIAFVHRAFCSTSLPHRRLADDSCWSHQQSAFSLSIQPLSIPPAATQPTLGVPYGSRARLLLIYIQSMAVHENARVVDLGPSMNNFLTRMGVSIGGRSYHLFREQAWRILHCRISVAPGDHHLLGGNQMELLCRGPLPDSLCHARLLLGEEFFLDLMAHPVAIWQPALKFLSSQSLSLDAYLWLAERLTSIVRPTCYTWVELHARFGLSYKNLFQFKPRFLHALKMALVVYPDARVTYNGASGVVLHPSKGPTADVRYELPHISGAL